MKFFIGEPRGHWKKGGAKLSGFSNGMHMGASLAIPSYYCLFLIFIDFFWSEIKYNLIKYKQWPRWLLGAQEEHCNDWIENR